jgi:hypothetical protein
MCATSDAICMHLTSCVSYMHSNLRHCVFYTVQYVCTYPVYTQVRQKQAFRQRIEAAREQIRARRSELVELRGGYDSDDEQHYFIENKTREVVVSVKTEVV